MNKQICKNVNNIVFVWSRNGANKTKAFAKGHSWRQNEDYVGRATCLSSSRTFLVFFHGFSYNGVCFHYYIPKLYPPSSFGPFLTNYDVTRIERKTAELLGINVLNEV